MVRYRCLTTGIRGITVVRPFVNRSPGPQTRPSHCGNESTWRLLLSTLTIAIFGLFILPPPIKLWEGWIKCLNIWHYQLGPRTHFPIYSWLGSALGDWQCNITDSSNILSGICWLRQAAWWNRKPVCWRD